MVLGKPDTFRDTLETLLAVLRRVYLPHDHASGLCSVRPIGNQRFLSRQPGNWLAIGLVINNDCLRFFF